MNRGAKSAVIGSAVVLLGAGGYGAYNVVHAVANMASSSSSPKVASTALATTPPSSAEAVKRAQSFLDSWKSGPDHYTGAASQTTDPGSAQDALQAYATGVKLSAISFGDVAVAAPTSALPASANGANDPTLETHVTFTVTAQVKGGTWSYPGSVDVIQSAGGLTSVNWAPSVLYPKLKSGDTLAAGTIPADAASVQVLAADGKTVLTAAKYPSLATIISTIAQHGGSSGSTSAGSGGSGIEVVDSSNNPVSTAKVFTPAKGASIRTTIDASLQAKAETAVRNSVLNNLPTATVALDWRTGRILAIAYANTGSAGNTALEAALAPGSTMKIITAAALFDKAGFSPSSPAPCPSTLAAASRSFKNDFGSAYPNDTIRTAFARSCNTAFIKQGFDKLVHGSSDTGALADEAANVFGLNGSWSIGGGVHETDATVPKAPDLPTAAADLIGQGNVLANPLTLASMAATVRNGGFKQPILIPGQAQTPAAQSISSTTASYLQTLMRAAAHDGEGTAFERVHMYANVGAKTGTSEVGTTNVTTNGWFTAYNDNIAVGALVQGGSTGVSSAGYVAAALLGATE
ncbi:penicillin-binding transpeptidase domain-containing protein [Streptacidiphilus sp. EB103A]|uniref:penicillin-binding transpeptidase domain-containing protein n=1 Tax=Streptacidiphilus sp. EB103A TaxID=3156275 RepID=UPI003519269C